MKKDENYQSLAEGYGIKADDVVRHHCGNCFSRITVKTREAAEKVAAKVEGQTVNGGMFDGMLLGKIEETKAGEFEVMI